MGGAIEHKNLVFGIYKRNGIVITFPVSDRKKTWDTYSLDKTIYQERIVVLFWWPYCICNVEYDWKTSSRCTCGRDEYVREDTHINGIEGFWSYAKTWLYHYRGVPKQYFHVYLKEIEFRFNNREKDIFYELSKLMIKSAPTM